MGSIMSVLKNTEHGLPELHIWLPIEALAFGKLSLTVSEMKQNTPG